jgi:hypothetical protein
VEEPEFCVDSSHRIFFARPIYHLSSLLKKKVQ